MTDSKDYDDIPGFMRVPKGESLSPSRNTAGAFRELVHGNDGLSHAEFFPKRQEKDEDDEGMTDAEKLAAAFAAGVTAVDCHRHGQAREATPNQEGSSPGRSCGA